MHTVAVVGLGYVGLPLALITEERGFRILGIDTDAKKVEQLRRRYAPFLSAEESLTFQHSTMDVTESGDAIREAGTVIVCVPTPVHEDHTPDLTPLINACELVGKNMQKGALVIIESTVNPGVCEEIALPLIEKHSGLSADADFHFAHAPERVNPGDTRWTTRNIPRVVGGTTEESTSRAVAFYRTILDAEVMPMGTIREAEAVKILENSFRDINIAFINELAMSFDRLGIDIMNVIKGASTKPFAFMAHYPGCGVGGHCIPVDPYYLIDYAEKNGFTHDFLKTARKINSGMPSYTVDLLESALLEEHSIALKGATVALLGLAYKRDVPDLRESPALVIKAELERRGAKVVAYDPYVSMEGNARSLGTALRLSDAAIIATDHTPFRRLTAKDFSERGIKVVIDGKNCLERSAFGTDGVTYRGIGRS